MLDLHEADNLKKTPNQRPVRACFVIDNLDRAGTESQLLMLIKYLDRRKIEPYLCLLDGQGETSRALEPGGCPVLRLGVQRLRSLRAARATRRFRRYLKENQIDLVQTYFIDSTRFAAPIARAASCTVVGSRRNIGHWVTPKDQWIARLYNRWFIDKIIVNCEAAHLSLVEQEKIRPDNVLVIPNGIELESFNQIGAWQAKPNETMQTVGMVGNLREIKGIDLFIRAAGKVLESEPNTRFQIAGGGDKASYQAMINELGLTGHVQLLGSVEAIPQFLATLDVAVLPSRAEGLSNALLEYMAAGRPIVASNVGGNPELIAHEQTGLLVPPEDIDSLAEAIIRLLEGEPLSTELAENARKKVLEIHSAEAVSQKLASVFTSACIAKKVK